MISARTARYALNNVIQLGSTTSDSPAPQTDPEVVMIDLTHDSPKRHLIRKAPSIENLKDNPIVMPDLFERVTLSTGDSPKPRVALDSHRKAVSVKISKENTTVKSAMSKQIKIRPLPASGSPNPHVALNGANIVLGEASPLPRLQVPASSRVKFEKMVSYQEIDGDMRNQRSPTSKMRDSTPSNVGIEKMKSFDSITDDGHHRRSSVKFDLPNIRKHPRRHNFKQDEARSRGRTSEIDGLQLNFLSHLATDFSRETEQNESKFSPIRRRRQERSNNSTFEPALKPMDKIINVRCTQYCYFFILMNGFAIDTR